MSADLSLDTLLEWYEQMLNIRYFEENAVSSFRKGLFGGSTHPQIAQEATAVGAAAALQPTDQVLATYRGHGHAICRGLSLGSIMAELLCKSTGCCGGRGGSMHLCDTERDFWGTNAIVAAHIPIAAGIALANQRRKNGRVVVVFFGDGATCEGAFFETLNMATLWKVPLVLVCENNGYAISVPTSKAHSVAEIADRALGFGLPGTSVDGNDPIAVYEEVGAAAERARNGEGPSLVECRTVRWEATQRHLVRRLRQRGGGAEMEDGGPDSPLREAACRARRARSGVRGDPAARQNQKRWGFAVCHQ